MEQTMNNINKLFTEALKMKNREEKEVSLSLLKFAQQELSSLILSLEKETESNTPTIGIYITDSFMPVSDVSSLLKQYSYQKAFPIFNDFLLVNEEDIDQEEAKEIHKVFRENPSQLHISYTLKSGSLVHVISL